MPDLPRSARRLFGVICSVLVFVGARNVSAGDSQEIRELMAKAASGDAEAQLYLGRAYDSGHGVKTDIAQAAKWYEAAAEQGNAEAQNSIGSLYLAGEGVSKDPIKACEWFTKSAAQQNIRGIGNLGTCYDFGIGTEKDQAKAAIEGLKEGWGLPNNWLGKIWNDGVVTDLDGIVRGDLHDYVP